MGGAAVSKTLIGGYICTIGGYSTPHKQPRVNTGDSGSPIAPICSTPGSLVVPLKLTFRDSGGFLRGMMILSRAHGLSPVLCDTNTSHSLPPRDAPLQADSSQGIMEEPSKHSHPHSLMTVRGTQQDTLHDVCLGCPQVYTVKCYSKWLQLPTECPTTYSGTST